MRDVSSVHLEFPVDKLRSEEQITQIVAPRCAPWLTKMDIGLTRIQCNSSVSCRTIRVPGSLYGNYVNVADHIDISRRDGVQYFYAIDEDLVVGCYIWCIFKKHRGRYSSRRFLWQFDATKFKECRYVVWMRNCSVPQEHVLFTREQLLQWMYNRRRRRTAAICQVFRKCDVAQSLSAVIWSYI